VPNTAQTTEINTHIEARIESEMEEQLEPKGNLPSCSQIFHHTTKQTSCSHLNNVFYKHSEAKKCGKKKIKETESRSCVRDNRVKCQQYFSAFSNAHGGQADFR
jgi:hypothetical protein